MLDIPLEKLKATLIEDGIITEEKFDAFAKDSRRMGQSVAGLLISKNVITDEYYKNLLAKFFNVPIAVLEPAKISPDVLNLLSEDFAREKHLVAFKREDNGAIDVAMEDPSDLATLEYLETKFQARVYPYLATGIDLSRIFAFYGKQ